MQTSGFTVPVSPLEMTCMAALGMRDLFLAAQHWIPRDLVLAAQHRIPVQLHVPVSLEMTAQWERTLRYDLSCEDIVQRRATLSAGAAL